MHGFDHVRWQDYIDDLGEAAIRAELEDAFEAYRAIFRAPPKGFAAPGWRTNATALKLLDRMGLSYRSDTRGSSPYRCVVGRGPSELPKSRPRCPRSTRSWTAPNSR